MEALYREIHDAEAHRILTTGWLRDVYPVRSTAEAAIRRDDLFVMEEAFDEWEGTKNKWWN